VCFENEEREGLCGELFGVYVRGFGASEGDSWKRGVSDPEL
jgi:hypothetical protein